MAVSGRGDRVHRRQSFPETILEKVSPAAYWFVKPRRDLLIEDLVNRILQADVSTIEHKTACLPIGFLEEDI